MDIEVSSESNFERSADFSIVLHPDVDTDRGEQLVDFSLATTGKRDVFREVLDAADNSRFAIGDRRMA